MPVLLVRGSFYTKRMCQEKTLTNGELKLKLIHVFLIFQFLRQL